MKVIRESSGLTFFVLLLLQHRPLRVECPGTVYGATFRASCATSPVPLTFTVGSAEIVTGADQRKLVPIGGIVHGGARGISKVEVQVDGGPWQAAAIRTPLSQLTWVIWRYDWPFQPGKHTFTVRCYDGSNTPQIILAMPPAPSGVSGLFSKSQKL